ncbi:MAG: dipeptide epimerase [Pseudomonadota bacterium]
MIDELRVRIEKKRWRRKSPLIIHGYRWDHVDVATVYVTAGGKTGRGEGAPLFYFGETADDLVNALIQSKARIEGGLTRADIPKLALPSGARNALDCALWDLEAKISDTPTFKSAGFENLRPVPFLCTLSIGEPGDMAREAKELSHVPILKLKLDGDRPVEKTAAVRDARPEATLLIDANCAWSPEELATFSPPLKDLGVEMVEQPMPPERDSFLDDYNSPIPLCADESCQTKESLPTLTGKYQLINIKLDKCGGLTPALSLANSAKEMGFDLMVGNMLGSSLAMAPAFLVAQLCRYSDLDGPVEFEKDCDSPMEFRDALVFPPTRELWG